MRCFIYSLIGMALLILPGILPKYPVILLTEILIISIFAMSLNLLVGYLGYTSLGHAAFFGVGAYSLALICMKGGIDNFFFCILAVLVVGTVFSFGFGILAMRVSSVYFLMITLAMGQMFWAVVWSWRSLTGGDDGLSGISRPVLGIPWNLADERSFFYFILIIFGLCVFVLFRIDRSPFGKALRGILNDELRMRVLGYNTWRYKYFCYGIAGIFGSLAGALKIYQEGFVDPSCANISHSGLVLLMVVIGGSGYFWGPVIGVIVVWIITRIVSSYMEYWSTVAGVILILSVLFFPEGLVGYWIKKKKSKGRKG